MANYDKSTGNNGTLRMSITYSQSVANNQTTFTVKYYLINTNSATYFTGIGWSGNTAGVNRSGTVSMSGSGTKTLGSWTVTKTHNADGTLPSAARTFSISLSATGTTGVGGPTSNSVTLSIPNIPRKSSTSASSYTVTAGNTVSVGIARHSSSFTHTVRFTLGAATHSITGVGTSTSYKVPENWINQIPNATSRVGTITLTTYSGSTNIGSSSVPFTVKVPTDVVPDVGTVTLTRNNKDTPAAWGIWVQNHSAAEIEVVGATAGQGANVSTIKTVVGSRTKWGDQVSFDISGSGTMNFITTVTDTRGRTASVTNTITVEPYAPISLQDISISRGNPNGSSPFDPDAEDGLWGGVKVIYDYSPVGDPNGGWNSVKMSVRYRASNSGTWITAFTNVGVSQNTWERFGDASLSLDNSYIVEVTLSDQFSSQEYTGTVSTAFVTMDFLKGGKGVAFGKVSTIPDTVEFDFKSKFNKDVEFLSDIDMSGVVDFGGLVRHNSSTEFNGPVVFNEAPEFKNLPPAFQHSAGSQVITATSWTDMAITTATEINITLEKPTWYVFTYRAWVYATEAVDNGDGRIGMRLSGATTKTESSPGWGDVIRIRRDDRAEYTIHYQLNPGTTNVMVRGYRTGSTGTVSVNYQVFRAVPMYPGYVA